MGRYMAKCENLEQPREGLIRQEIIEAISRHNYIETTLLR